MRFKGDDRPGATRSAIDTITSRRINIVNFEASSQLDSVSFELSCSGLETLDPKDASDHLTDALRAAGFRDISIKRLTPLNIEWSRQALVQDGRIKNIDWRSQVERMFHDEIGAPHIDLSRAVISSDTELRMLRFVFPLRGSFSLRINHHDEHGALKTIVDTIAAHNVNILSAVLSRGRTSSHTALLSAICEPNEGKSGIHQNESLIAALEQLPTVVEVTTPDITTRGTVRSISKPTPRATHVEGYKSPRRFVSADEVNTGAETSHGPARLPDAATIAESARVKTETWDVFIAHAGEDKDMLVRPLAKALVDAGLRVWYDEFTLKVGDSLRDSIDHGLVESRFGIVILSAHFFRKDWPKRELDGLLAKDSDKRKVVLPIWHQIDKEQVSGFSPSLAGIIAMQSSRGITSLVDEILEVTRGSFQCRSIRLFLSYSESALQHVKLIEDELGEYNEIVTNRISEPAELPNSTPLEIRSSRCFVGIWHPNAFGDPSISPWMPFEFGIAQQSELPVMLLVNENVDENITQRLEGHVSTYSDLHFARDTLPVIQEFCRMVGTDDNEL